jgi:hypothetical protein
MIYRIPAAVSTPDSQPGRGDGSVLSTHRCSRPHPVRSRTSPARRRLAPANLRLGFATLSTADFTGVVWKPNQTDDIEAEEYV